MGVKEETKLGKAEKLLFLVRAESTQVQPADR